VASVLHSKYIRSFYK